MREIYNMLSDVVRVWIVIFLIVTCPLWVVPYTIYRKVKGGAE